MTRARDVANIDGLLTTKGDIYAATAAATPDRLAVGNNGETLVADSSTSTGLRYTAGTVQSNPVLNSAFQIWQRGTSFTTTGYTADRWSSNIGANFTFSRQLTNDTTNLPNIQYCIRLQRNSGATTVAFPQVANSFETVNSIPYAGKTVTLSFYARRGANWSGASSQIFALLQTGTGTDQNLVNVYTGAAQPINSPVVLTTTWQRFNFTGTVATSATEMGVQFYGETAGTAGAADFYEITGVQLDVGSVALPFRTYAGTIQGELAACQRYYIRFGDPIGAGYSTVCPNGYFPSTTQFVGNLQMPVTMRISPSSVDYATLQTVDNTIGSQSITAIAMSFSNPTTVSIAATVSGATATRTGYLRQNNSTAAYLAFNAEL